MIQKLVLKCPHMPWATKHIAKYGNIHWWTAIFIIILGQFDRRTPCTLMQRTIDLWLHLADNYVLPATEIQPAASRRLAPMRSIEPQSHRATEPQSHRATEPQSHRATEPHSHRATEPHSHRATEPQTGVQKIHCNCIYNIDYSYSITKACGVSTGLGIT